MLNINLKVIKYKLLYIKSSLIGLYTGNKKVYKKLYLFNFEYFYTSKKLGFFNYHKTLLQLIKIFNFLMYSLKSKNCFLFILDKLIFNYINKNKFFVIKPNSCCLIYD